MLRRYGEQALQEEIRALLSDWAEDLAASERIFIRASTHGKRSFWGYDGAVLDKLDDRIRTFPFPTRRPVSRPDPTILSSEFTSFSARWTPLTPVDSARAAAVLARAHPGQDLAPLRRGPAGARRRLYRFSPTSQGSSETCCCACSGGAGSCAA